jgi:predicted nucleic acid-binding protein
VTRLPKPCVVDASVGVRLFLPEEYAQQVHELFESAVGEGSGSLFVPDLFFIECANVLWKKVRRSEYSEEMALANLSDLRALDLPTTPTTELMERALEIACQCGTTACDACYVALAERNDIPLLTADSRLANIVSSGKGFEVVVLGE